MNKSESIKELAIALNHFQDEMESVKRDATNPFFKSKYAPLESIITSIKPLLAKHGLSFSQLPSGENELSTIIMHVSGEWIESTVKMSPKDNTPQGQGSAITYMRRYALGAAFGIATEEDDDGNIASTPKKEVKQEAKQEVARPVGNRNATEKQIRFMAQIGKRLGYDEGEVMDMARKMGGEDYQSSKDIPMGVATKLIDALLKEETSKRETTEEHIDYGEQ